MSDRCEITEELPQGAELDINIPMHHGRNLEPDIAKHTKSDTMPASIGNGNAVSTIKISVAVTDIWHNLQSASCIPAGRYKGRS